MTLPLPHAIASDLRAWRAPALVGLVVLATWNLTAWPETWFDEGAHLMVSKSLVQSGVYADYDVDGYRYFGATLGVGPTVLLPIAAVFEVFGVGLLQARAVMAVYLVLAVVAFHAMARRVAGDLTALVASMLLVTSAGIGTLEFGREVLGEVPALLFLCLGLRELLRADETARPWRLVSAGVLLGLAAVTKYQALGVALLGLGLAWLPGLGGAGRPLLVFLVPALVTLATFAGWQAVLLGYLGPASFADNVRYVRSAAGGAALTFSFDSTIAAGRVLLQPGVLLGALTPGLAYGVARAVRREDASLGWRIVMGPALVALSWFVLASIGWRRYAYPGLALACLPAAALLVDLLAPAVGSHRPTPRPPAVRWATFLWLAAMVVLPLVVLLPRVAAPPAPHAALMASAIDRTVPAGALVAAWEPEITFLTDRRYRVPPQELLPVAVAHVWSGGPPPASVYDFMAGEAPDFVVEGPFARGVGLFPRDRLHAHFALVEQHGPYALYRRRPGPR